MPFAVVLLALVPPFAPTTTAVPFISEQLEVESQRYVSPPLDVLPVAPRPIAKVLVAPGIKFTFIDLEYAPPPPPAAPLLSFEEYPAPPPPIISILLAESSQSLGTTQVIAFGAFRA